MLNFIAAKLNFVLELVLLVILYYLRHQIWSVVHNNRPLYVDFYYEIRKKHDKKVFFSEINLHIKRKRLIVLGTCVYSLVHVYIPWYMCIFLGIFVYNNLFLLMWWVHGAPEINIHIIYQITET